MLICGLQIFLYGKWHEIRYGHHAGEPAQWHVMNDYRLIFVPIINILALFLPVVEILQAFA